MREQVLIVLNEREAAKQRAAVALSEALSMRRLSSSRLRPGPRLTEILLERRPEVVILDYLLGDEGTALDVLAHLRDLSSGAMLPVIVWTDDPSVSAAVSAMKLGAIDYVELDGPRNFERLLRTIDHARAEAKTAFQSRHVRSSARSSFRTEDLVAESAPMKALLNELRSAMRSGAGTVVLHGPSGSGRTTIARHAHQLRSGAGVFVEHALELYDGTPDDVFAGRHSRPPLLAGAATVLLEHAEFDDGGLYASAARMAQRGRDPSTLFVVGTSDAETAHLWHTACEAPVVTLPPLEHRREDLLPLLQRWAAEAKATGLGIRWTPGRTTVEAMSSWTWPHHVRQLRRCVFDAFGAVADGSVIADDDQVIAGGSGDDRERRFLIALSQSKNRFESYATLSPLVPPAPAARFEYERARHNEMVAAVRLGVGIPQLRRALNEHPAEKPGARLPNGPGGA